MQLKYLVLFFSLGWLHIGNQNKSAEEGKASYYADKLAGKSTASGQPYDPQKLTGAHKTLPFGTEVMVTNIQNDKSVKVTINDRGPFVMGRIIDLSKAAAERIGIIRTGVAQVKVEVVKRKK